MHQEHELAGLGVSHSHGPEAHAVVELPGVDIFDGIFGRVGTNLPKMQAQLSNVQEAELITCLPLHAEHLDETVLRYAQLVLHLQAAATKLTHSGVLIVHLFEHLFEQRVSFVAFIGIEEHFTGEKASQSVEGEDGGGFVELGGVVHDEGAESNRQLLVVESVGGHAHSDGRALTEEEGQKRAVAVF